MLHPVMASEVPVLQRDGNFCSAVESIIGKDSTRVREASERKVDLKMKGCWILEKRCLYVDIHLPQWKSPVVNEPPS